MKVEEEVAKRILINKALIHNFGIVAEKHEAHSEELFELTKRAELIKLKMILISKHLGEPVEITEQIEMLEDIINTLQVRISH